MLIVNSMYCFFLQYLVLSYFIPAFKYTFLQASYKTLIPRIQTFFLPQLMFRTLIFLWKQEKCDVPSTKSFSQWSPRICAPIYEQWNACEMGTFQRKIAYIMLKLLLQSHRKWVGRVGTHCFFYNYEYPKKGHLLILLSRLARVKSTNWDFSQKVVTGFQKFFLFWVLMNP